MTGRLAIALGAAAFAPAALTLAGCGADPVPAAAPPPPVTAPTSAAPAPAPAPAAPRSEPFALVPDAPGDVVEVAGAPGERVPVPLRLANGAGAERGFSLRADDPLLTVPARVSVPARQSVAVAGVLSIPAGARPGARRATVTARADAPGDGAVRVSYRSAVAVRVRVVSP
ncbi:MAG: hypothetical protein AB7V42_02255 [Thermoleophilia bacterium]